MGGSAPNEDQMDVCCLFGVSPCHFGRPQKFWRKSLSGILEGCIGTMFSQRAKKLAQWLRGRRSNTSLMALMAHQFPLILLFLLPHTCWFLSSSCSLQIYSAWASPDHVSTKSIPSKGKKLPNWVISPSFANIFRILCPFFLPFLWFEMVDTWNQDYRRHLHTLFDRNAWGIDECSPGWMDVVVWWDHMTNPVDQTKCKILLMTSGCILEYFKQLINE